MEKYPVSKNKLYEELKRRGVTPAQASQEIGFSAGYISNNAMKGEMPARAALYLERIYSIKPEDYQPDLLDEIEKAKGGETIPPDAIRTAAETFARVLLETYRETYRETLRSAIVEALQEREAAKRGKIDAIQERNA